MLFVLLLLLLVDDPDVFPRESNGLDPDPERQTAGMGIFPREAGRSITNSSSLSVKALAPEYGERDEEVAPISGESAVGVDKNVVIALVFRRTPFPHSFSLSFAITSLRKRGLLRRRARFTSGLNNSDSDAI